MYIYGSPNFQLQQFWLIQNTICSEVKLIIKKNFMENFLKQWYYFFAFSDDEARMMGNDYYINDTETSTSRVNYIWIFF